MCTVHEILPEESYMDSKPGSHNGLGSAEKVVHVNCDDPDVQVLSINGESIEQVSVEMIDLVEEPAPTPPPRSPCLQIDLTNEDEEIVERSNYLGQPLLTFPMEDFVLLTTTQRESMTAE